MVPKRKDVVKVVVLFWGVGVECAHGCDKKGESVEQPIQISLWRATAGPAETTLVKVLA